MAFGSIGELAEANEKPSLGVFVEHNHHHSHDTNHKHHSDFSSSVVASVEEHLDQDDLHEHQHKHSISIQLNIDLPTIFAIHINSEESPPLTTYRSDLNSLTYAPAVPPPNNL